jgi:hypothetical protein
VPPNQVIIKIKSDKNSEQQILNNSVLLDEGSNATFLCESYGGIRDKNYFFLNITRFHFFPN